MKSKVAEDDTIPCSILRLHGKLTIESRDRAAEQGAQVVSSTPLQSGQANSTSAEGGMVCLRVVPVKVRRPDDASRTVGTYALLDSGSDISLCDKNLADVLFDNSRERR